MGVSRTAGYPDFSNATGTKNIPILFSSKLLVKFYKTTVFGEIANTDYEGEVKNQGDEVIIRTIPDLTIRPYVKGQKLVLERPSSAAVSLVIDKANYYNAGLDDIDAKQFDIAMMDKWADEASQQMKIGIDSEILTFLDGEEHTSNSGANAGLISQNINLGTTGAPLAIDKTNALDIVVQANQVLDEQDVPEEGRWMVIPAMMATRLKLSDLKNTSMTGDSVSPIRNGRLGMIDGITMYKSNQVLKVGSNYSIPFGHKSALTFAMQLTKSEVYRPQDTFADAIKGLQLYGYDVIKSESLGIIVATAA